MDYIKLAHIRSRYSNKTGEGLRRQLAEAGLPPAQFGPLAGFPNALVRDIVAGKRDGSISPLFVNAVEFAALYADELRLRMSDVPAPTDEHGYIIDAELTGSDINMRLAAIAWSKADFARFTGWTDRGIRKITSGARDGRIIRPLRWSLELVERKPLWYQAMPELRTPHHNSSARREAIMWASNENGATARAVRTEERRPLRLRTSEARRS